MVDTLRIIGGTRLEGSVSMSGAKNAALPIIAATLLTGRISRLTNVPALTDVTSMEDAVRSVGGAVERHGDTSCIDTSGARDADVDYASVRRMRAVLLLLAPMLARFGVARVARPGGCAIGGRPIDEHVAALRALGAEVEDAGDTIQARAPKGLHGARIALRVPSVGATHMALMAATAARGETEIVNAAMEPEVGDLIAYLKDAGAQIAGEGTARLVVSGPTSWRDVEHELIPDRIEAGSYLLASAITGGRLEVMGARLEHLGALVGTMERAGLSVFPTSRGLMAERSGPLRGVEVRTDAFPGFPTDLQAQVMALATVADGPSVIEETIFENRFMHVPELQRLGARIRLRGQVASIEGGARLRGTDVEATDLRASMGLVLAALAAEGVTVLRGAHHLDRGYVDIVRKLQRCGARIERGAS